MLKGTYDAYRCYDCHKLTVNVFMRMGNCERCGSYQYRGAAKIGLLEGVILLLRLYFYERNLNKESVKNETVK